MRSLLLRLANISLVPLPHHRQCHRRHGLVQRLLRIEAMRPTRFPFETAQWRIVVTVAAAAAASPAVALLRGIIAGANREATILLILLKPQ